MKKHLGHYEIVAEIGRGGMGVVYKGYEPSLARYVAIKELSPMLAHDPVVVERFLREARPMALLNDPHIIQIYSIGQENDEPFFVMEFVDGESVAALLKRDGRLESDDALKIILQAARGLSMAHDRGVIHRDVKPANLMINQRGQVKIADFGIALANHDLSAKLTSAGDVVGTAAYLSPEVTQGHSVDSRSEVYSVGIVLFEMLSGRTPFSDSNVYKLMHDVVESKVPDVREFNSQIDPEAAAIVAKMLAKDPADRYQTMHELISDLEKHPLVSGGGPIKANVVPPAASAETAVGRSTPLTPGFGPRFPTPPPDMGRRQSAITPVITSVLVTPRSAANAPIPAKPAASEPMPVSQDRRAPVTEKKSRRPILIVVLLIFLASAAWIFRGQLMGSSGTTTAGVQAIATAPVHRNLGVVYFEAALVTALGLALTGFWFGRYRRRRGEREAGILSLANMKWRDCIGLVFEALGREGYKEAPGPKPQGDGGTEFLLLRGNERVLLGFKLGTAYRISEANVHEFAKGLQMQGATSGILLTLGSVEGSVRDLAKRIGIQVIDGFALWPKVRQFVPANILDHVRLKVGAQTRKGLWIGGLTSVLLGIATFLFASAQVYPTADDGIADATAAPPTRTATATALPNNAAFKQSNPITQTTTERVALTDQQRAERRAHAAKQVSEIGQVTHASWPTESTLQVELKQTDGTDAKLIADVCGILKQYQEMQLTRLQLDSPDKSSSSVRWGQCQ